jgi:hypothetical protein
MKKNILTLIGILCFLLVGTGYAQDRFTAPSGKGPARDAKVLVIFVDSLRPDIVEMMVEQGKLPNIKKLFFDQGLRFPNFFSTYPSLTVNAYTCLITGKFPDQSGMKAQSLFERFPTRKKNVMKRMFRVSEEYPRFFNMLTKPEVAPRVLKQNKVKALYDLLKEEYHTSLVPVSPTVTPWAWPHVAANDVERPYVITTEAMEKLDDLNGKYGLNYMVTDTRGRLFIVWFTLLDEDQHRHEGGQFSEAAQKRMEVVDEWLGKIRNGFIRQDNGREPYVILFSDHGAYGGRDGIYNQPYYLARDFFYKILKINVRGPDYTMHHPGTDLDSYAYIDNMGRGQARIFLPVADSMSWNWSRPNTLYELRHYGLGPNRKPVDLVQQILDIDLTERNQFPDKIDPHPVDLMFIKLSEDLIYVIGQNRAEALIRIKREDGKTRYRYTPVKDVVQDADGKLNYQETSEKDPFRYLQDPGFRAGASGNVLQFLGEYHDDKEWLDTTCETDYPDAITALSRSFIWKPELQHLAQSQDPDICLSAAPGWNFRIEDIKGADHGAIRRDALRSTLMISGPHIRQGTDPTPHRIVDVTLTLLQLIGYKKPVEMDSSAIEGIYE